jgi:hypothetical protein
MTHFGLNYQHIDKKALFLFLFYQHFGNFAPTLGKNPTTFGKKLATLGNQFDALGVKSLC